METTEFYSLVNDLESTSSTTTKHEIIGDLVWENPRDWWRPAVLLLAGQRFDNNGVAPKTAITAISDAFDVSEDMIERLYNDRGTVTEAVDALVSKHNITIPSTTLDELVADLERVADASGNEQVELLSEVFQNHHPPVVAFGVLADDYSIGVTKKTISSGVAKDASRAEVERGRGLLPDAVEFAEFVQDNPSEFPPSLEVGRAFEPMKAKSKDLPEDGDDEWVAQLKVDGYRLLIHIDDGEATAFTRNCDDVTHSLPELEEVEWPDGQFVFDCEAIAYSENGEPLGYRATSKRIGRKHNIDDFDSKIHFECFDCLYANGDIADEPFRQRFSTLTDTLPRHEYTRVLEPISSINEAKAIAEDEGYEGLIVKEWSAPYKFDKRSNHWRKFKLMDETVDLVAIEFERGKGNDADTLGRIGLETKDGEFMGYVGNGWTDEQQDEIWENQDEYYGEVMEVSFEGFDEKLRFPVFKTWRQDGEADSLERVRNIGAAY